MPGHVYPPAPITQRATDASSTAPRRDFPQDEQVGSGSSSRSLYHVPQSQHNRSNREPGKEPASASHGRHKLSYLSFGIPNRRRNHCESIGQSISGLDCPASPNHINPVVPVQQAQAISTPAQ